MPRKFITNNKIDVFNHSSPINMFPDKLQKYKENLGLVFFTGSASFSTNHKEFKFGELCFFGIMYCFYVPNND